jgi:hypothetical protein
MQEAVAVAVGLVMVALLVLVAVERGKDQGKQARLVPLTLGAAVVVVVMLAHQKTRLPEAQAS